ncbi:MAG: class I SAM-dependent methyltransferase [Acidimicrobiaceae bacterium]|nr:class I SAM-dependent methyltransferase [Acidimicrobiaceae bacterium]
MNENHKRCGSDEWRALMRESILPWALGDLDLGEEVLEVGPGYGATTDVVAGSVRKLTAVEIDAELAAMLIDRFAGNDQVVIVQGDATKLDFPDERFSGAVCFTMLHHVPTVALQDRLFAEVARVLRPGSVFVSSDSLASADLEEHHRGDTYNPIDPDTVGRRLEAAGFASVGVKTNPFGWAAVARKASSL